MSFETLTLKSVRARPVVLKLKRPVIARIATLADWPLILIDFYTEEGVIGRSYLALRHVGLDHVVLAQPAARRSAVGSDLGRLAG
jgi:hypothetical protein